MDWITRLKEMTDYFLNRYFVRDNGVGIDSKDEEQVFKAFKRVAGEDYSGSGIGLVVVKRIIEKQLFIIWWLMMIFGERIRKNKIAVNQIYNYLEELPGDNEEQQENIDKIRNNIEKFK